MAKTMRNFRLDDAVFKAAQARARHEYTTVTAVVEHALREYAGLPTLAIQDGELPPPANTGQAAAQRAYKRAIKEENTR